MGLVMEGLVVPSFILSMFYLLLAIYGGFCLRRLHRVNPALNTKKVLVMNCLLSSFLRFLSFASMSGLNYWDYDISVETDGSRNDGSKIAIFFDKSALVLFDLPDYCFVSAYVLLLVIWAEAILQSRKHWLSATSFRKRWLLIFVVFNIILYSVQVSLYMFLFVPAVDQNILVNLIYLAMGVINIGLPILWMCCYLYLTIAFSGFPYHSAVAYYRMTSLNRLGGFWTLTRLLWGLASLTTATKGWLQDGRYSETMSALGLIFIFIVCEILPVIYSYQSSSLKCLVETTSQDQGVVSPLHIDEKQRESYVDTSQTILSAEEVPTDAMNKAMGSYFGASPLQRSMTWGSGYEEDDETGRLSDSFGTHKPKPIASYISSGNMVTRNTGIVNSSQQENYGDQGRRSDMSAVTGSDVDGCGGSSGNTGGSWSGWFWW